LELKYQGGTDIIPELEDSEVEVEVDGGKPARERRSGGMRNEARAQGEKLKKLQSRLEGKQRSSRKDGSVTER